MTARTWIERFPASELNRRLDDVKRAKRDGWDLTVLIPRGSADVIVLGAWRPFGHVPSGVGYVPVVTVPERRP